MLAYLLQGAMTASVLALGLDASAADILYLWHRPGLLLRSFIAMYLAMPLIAVFLVLLMAIPPGRSLGLVLVAISAGAPLLPKTMLKLGCNPPYVYSLLVSTSLAAVLTIPASLAVLGSVLPEDVRESPLPVAVVIARTFLIPLVVGTLLRSCAPLAVDRIRGRVSQVSGLVLVAVLTGLLALNVSAVLVVDLPSLGAIAILTFAGLAVGHLLGGPQPDDRTCLALASSTRHSGLAAVIALTNFPNARPLPIVLVFMVVSIVATIPYAHCASGNSLREPQRGRSGTEPCGEKHALRSTDAREEARDSSRPHRGVPGGAEQGLEGVSLGSAPSRTWTLSYRRRRAWPLNTRVDLGRGAVAPPSGSRALCPRRLSRGVVLPSAQSEPRSAIAARVGQDRSLIQVLGPAEIVEPLAGQEFGQRSQCGFRGTELGKLSRHGRRPIGQVQAKTIGAEPGLNLIGLREHARGEREARQQVPGGPVPEIDPELRLGHDPSPVRREVAGADRGGMVQGPTGQLPGLGVPDPRDRVARGDEYPPAIRAELQAVGDAPEPLRVVVQQPAGRDVPDGERPGAGGCGGHPAPIRAHRRVRDPPGGLPGTEDDRRLLRGLEGAQQATAGRRIPDLERLGAVDQDEDGPVAAGAEPVPLEDQVGEVAGLQSFRPEEGPRCLAAGDIPSEDALILHDREERAAVGGEESGLDRAGMIETADRTGRVPPGDLDDRRCVAPEPRLDPARRVEGPVFPGRADDGPQPVRLAIREIVWPEPLRRLQRPDAHRPVLAGREAAPTVLREGERPAPRGAPLSRPHGRPAPEVPEVDDRAGTASHQALAPWVEDGVLDGTGVPQLGLHRAVACREDRRREDRVQGEHDARPVGAPAERRDAILHGVRGQPVLAGGRVPDMQGFIGGEDARTVRAERGVAAVSVLDVDLVLGGVG